MFMLEQRKEENTQTRWRCEWQITTRLSVSTHSTKCHHIKMCARKIKANVQRHSVSPVAGYMLQVRSYYTRTPANPVHFTFSLTLCLSRCMAINSFGRFRFFFSCYRTRSFRVALALVDICSQTNENFFIFICLNRIFWLCFCFHCIYSWILLLLLLSCVTFVLSKCKTQQQQI